MRHPRLAALLFAATLAGCFHHKRDAHISGGVLGRVVIYRNGVAFYERSAKIVDGRLAVRVPRERVDDFLKSLTVVDRATKQPLSVSIPRKQSEDGASLTMLLETPHLRHADVMLTYVTEAPAWKPSYRVVVGRNGKLMLEAWAIVDNTTSEDWNGVLVGVGASSALAFRYDLWSVHTVDRDLLAAEERFAVAPPNGVSPYSDNVTAEEIGSLDGGGGDYGVSFSGSSNLEGQYRIDGVNTTGIATKEPSPPPVSATTGAIQGVITDAKTGEKLPGVTVLVTGKRGETQTAITDNDGLYKIGGLAPDDYKVAFYYGDSVVERSGVSVGVNKVTPVFQKLAPSTGRGETIAIHDRVPTIEPTSTTQGITLDKNYLKHIPTGRTFGGVLGSASGSHSDALAPTPAPAKTQQQLLDEQLASIVARVQKDRRDVVIEVHGAPGSEQQAVAKGTALKHKLVDQGVGASKIHVVPKLAPGVAERVRFLSIAPNAKPESALAPPIAKISDTDTPVGESHFEAEKPMTVRSGSSAMVATLHTEAEGGVVYLFDPISDRGHKRFAFRALRLDNPTDHTLEPGPVTVYGDGRFIGEGITEPVPPHAVAVIPFALDKQVVIEREGAEQDQIAKLVTVQRGVLTAEVQHRRDTTFAITSRLAVPTTVYLRHRLESGWALVDQPDGHPDGVERVGDSHLFRVDLKPRETKRVLIAEATPLERTFDLNHADALGAMKVFIDEPKASPALKRQVELLLATHRSTADLVDKIATLREQIAEYRSRSGELHAQVMTLKAVRTSGELMVALKAKLAEMADRTQKATIAIVEAQEQLMLARVKFQNQLAELELTDQTEVTRK